MLRWSLRQVSHPHLRWLRELEMYIQHPLLKTVATQTVGLHHTHAQICPPHPPIPILHLWDCAAHSAKMNGVNHWLVIIGWIVSSTKEERLVNILNNIKGEEMFISHQMKG